MLNPREVRGGGCPREEQGGQQWGAGGGCAGLFAAGMKLFQYLNTEHQFRTVSSRW